MNLNELRPEFINSLAEGKKIDIIYQEENENDKNDKNNKEILILPLKDLPLQRLISFATCQFYGLHTQVY